jgi:hypothetical protein
VSAANALEEVGKRHPELRDWCVEVLVRQLEAWPEQSEGLNGFLIDYLVELGAVEAAPLMQAAFESGRADELIRSDWEDVQIDLGLLEERLTPPRPSPWMAPAGDFRRRKGEKAAQGAEAGGQAQGEEVGEAKAREARAPATSPRESVARGFPDNDESNNERRCHEP